MQQIKDMATQKANYGEASVEAKLKKIVEAAVVISSVLKDTEPIRNEIQQVSFDLLASIQKAFHAKPFQTSLLFFESEYALGEIIHYVDHLFHLFSYGEKAKIISHMNADIFISETTKIIIEVQELFAKKESAFSSHSYSFTHVPNLRERIEDTFAKAGKNEAHVSAALGVFTEAKSNIKDIKDKKDIKDNSQERKEKITQFLKDKGQSSIVDIATFIPEYSQKTIQRALNELIDARIVKRVGDRRWSAYCLVE